MPDAAVVIVGGTSGICQRLAERYSAGGRAVVISGRDLERTQAAAAAMPGPGKVEACTLDLSAPDSIAEQLAGVGAVDRLVVGAVERDENTVAAYDVQRAIRLVTLKLVGYTEVVHALIPRLTPDASIL
ncbi:MAG TPA: SDR family NAD(P)-dependent oxidoreductase, partial [Gaiellaceae bacterium]